MSLKDAESFRSSRYQRLLREAIIKHFTLEELRVLAHDLSVDWDNLPGESKPRKTLELINYLFRHNRLSPLTSMLRDVRPQVTWPGLPAGTVVSIEFDYSVRGTSEKGESFLEGKAGATWELEADTCFDEGMAASEAMASIASHFYIFELEKNHAFHLQDLTISIHNLEWDWK